jgi:hypothetical protein
MDAGAATQADYLNALTGCATARLKEEQCVFMRKIILVQMAFARGDDLKF